MTDYNKLLRDEPLFWSRLGFCYDPPIKDAAGRPLIMYADQSRFVRYHRQFADAGVRIHTSILHADTDCVRTDGAKAMLLVRERKD